jgi:hypothetical protein
MFDHIQRIPKASVSERLGIYLHGWQLLNEVARRARIAPSLAQPPHRAVERHPTMAVERHPTMLMLDSVGVERRVPLRVASSAKDIWGLSVDANQRQLLVRVAMSGSNKWENRERSAEERR